jgi:hypothetical protein
MGRFSEKDFEFAPAWRPRQGDILEGKVLERSSRVTDYGEYPILTLEGEGGRIQGGELVSGEIAVHGVHTALKNQIEDKNPQPGDYVGILFQGKIERVDAEDFFGYRMRVERDNKPEPPEGAWGAPGPSAPSGDGDDADDVPF